MMLEQKAPVFPQQYASQAQMAQGSYSPMQDPNFHSMGQRPSYATLRMQPRPSLRPTGLVQNQPNQLRLQLQHRLQAQQVCAGGGPEARGRGWGGAQGRQTSGGAVIVCPLDAFGLIPCFLEGRNLLQDDPTISILLLSFFLLH